MCTKLIQFDHIQKSNSLLKNNIHLQHLQINRIQQIFRSHSRNVITFNTKIHIQHLLLIIFNKHLKDEMHHIQQLLSHLSLHVNCQSHSTDILSNIFQPHSTHRDCKPHLHSTKKICQQIPLCISKLSLNYAHVLSKSQTVEVVLVIQIRNLISSEKKYTTEKLQNSSSGAQFKTRINVICCWELVVQCTLMSQSTVPDRVQSQNNLSGKWKRPLPYRNCKHPWLYLLDLPLASQEFPLVSSLTLNKAIYEEEFLAWTVEIYGVSLKGELNPVINFF